MNYTAPKLLDLKQKNLRMKFLAQNVDFSSLSFDPPPTFKEFSLRGRSNMGTPWKCIIIFCTLYTDFPDGSTDVVARHVSFVQITSCNLRRGFKLTTLSAWLSLNHG